VAFLNNAVYDNGLNEILTCDEVWICSDLPETYAQATTSHDGTSGRYALGKYTIQSGNIVGPENRNGSGSGRRVRVQDIINGSVDALDPNVSVTATHWAMVDSSRNLLLASQQLQFSQVVTGGNLFNLSNFSVDFPAPVTE
jgi:hypothetical protein